MPSSRRTVCRNGLMLARYCGSTQFCSKRSMIDVSAMVASMPAKMPKNTPEMAEIFLLGVVRSTVRATPTSTTAISTGTHQEMFVGSLDVASGACRMAMVMMRMMNAIRTMRTKSVRWRSAASAGVYAGVGAWGGEGLVTDQVYVVAGGGGPR